MFFVELIYSDYREERHKAARMSVNADEGNVMIDGEMYTGVSTVHIRSPDEVAVDPAWSGVSL